MELQKLQQGETLKELTEVELQELKDNIDDDSNGSQLSKLTLNYAKGLRYARYPLPLLDTNPGLRSAQQSEPQKSIAELNVWPNPTTGILHIQLTGEVELATIWQLTDLQNRITELEYVHLERNTWLLNTNSIAAGTYLLAGKAGSSHWQTKIIVLP